jgi:hypothetical protein
VRFLIDADLPRSTKFLVARAGHEASDVRDIGLRSAKDSEIALYAQKSKSCLLTGNFGFADVRNYPPRLYSGIVVFELPRNAAAPYFLHRIEEFLRQTDVVEQMNGRLAIVQPGRVRVRSC